jgi:hypothetical protein
MFQRRRFWLIAQGESRDKGMKRFQKMFEKTEIVQGVEMEARKLCVLYRKTSVRRTLYTILRFDKNKR